MITYLAFSAICMGLLLLFYHSVLEKEKMLRLNRGYLIFSLIFSLVIPFIPVGLADTVLPWFHGLQTPEVQSFQFLFPFNAEPSQFAADVNGDVIPLQTRGEPSSSGFLTQLALFAYFLITALLLIRLLRIVTIIRMKIKRNPCRFFKNCKVVLLDEKEVPHTFTNTIFVNRKQYQNGKIRSEVLVHEYTHAKQKHTLDILFVELLKLIFWFNPILYFYKKAILLNHEFLADEAVISRGAAVSEYQTLLLNTLMAHPAGRLTNNFDCPITKKRFNMMTQTTSRLRSFLKYSALLPLLVLLGVLLGCESTAVDHKAPDDPVTVDILDSKWAKLNGEKTPLSELEEDLAQFSEGPETDFQLNIHPDAPMGVVWDVQQLINQNNRSGSSHISVKVVEIEIIDAETIRLQGEKITFQNLKKRLVELNTKNDLMINFSIHDFSTYADWPSALIFDIEEAIRNSGTKRVNYSVTGDAS
ncbi:MAG TPA: M56 family metallopeptidase [Fodinibius sp.]|nr:M56 family metallopeptidase [Fodinibius sp.]